MALVTGAGREKDALSVGITFAMPGGVTQGKHGNDFQTGSSFSSAKADAYGAYIISRHPDVLRVEVVELMKQCSRPSIGSASRSERVRQYVSIMVDALANQKKKKHK